MGTIQVDNLGGTPGNIQTDVDGGVVSFSAVKAPCYVFANTNITLSGEQTINSVAVAAGKRVLVGGQTAGAENGVYVAAAGAWSRAPDFNSNSDVREGTQIRVTDGTLAGLYEVTTSDPISLGVTSLAIALTGLLDTTTVQALIDASLTTYVSDSDLAAALIDTALSGNPTAPTAPAGDDDNTIASTEFVQQEITSSGARIKRIVLNEIYGAG
jgi:hypothetical protein